MTIRFLLYCAILSDFLFSTVPAQTVNNELISKINSMQTTWQAGVNNISFPKKFERRARLKKRGPKWKKRPYHPVYNPYPYPYPHYPYPAYPPYPVYPPYNPYPPNNQYPPYPAYPTYPPPHRPKNPTKRPKKPTKRPKPPPPHVTEPPEPTEPTEPSNITNSPTTPDNQQPWVRFFNAKTHWPRCENILSRIRDQGTCGSGWAVATASMLSDRVCIHSNGTKRYHFSAYDLMTCCEDCLLGDEIPPCEGGHVDSAMEHFSLKGLVTGGEAGSFEGCKPYHKEYYIGEGNHECSKYCTNLSYRKRYKEDLVKGQGPGVYFVPKDEEKIRFEIYNNGPVVAQIVVFEDLIYYKSGVYSHKLGIKLGYHHVKIIGWGDRDEDRYWIVVNSHGKLFGNKGIMHFIRGVDNCGIEADIVTMRDVVETPNWARQAEIHVTKGRVAKLLHASFAEIIFLCIFVCLCL